MIEGLLRVITALLCLVCALGTFAVSFTDLPGSLIAIPFGLGLLKLASECLKKPPQGLVRPGGASVKKAAVPGWFLPAGIIALILAILAFLASAAIEGRDGRSDLTVCLFSGAFNPIFFIGMPLGMYWVVRYAKQPTIGVNPSAPPSARPAPEANPRLTHCPDCGGHVSRLAAACPHCGRPMNQEP